VSCQPGRRTLIIGDAMRYLLLGPLEIGHNGRPIQLGGPRPEKVMAALLIDANRAVPVDRLVDVLWDDQPPAGAVKQVRNCVSLARAALSRAGLPGPVSSVGTGYRITVEENDLDLLVFRAHLGRARQLIRDRALGQAARQLGDALSLWRGPVLAGLHSQILLPATAHLSEQRMAALEQLADLELKLGRHQHLVGPLTEAAAEHPLREELVSHLMLALYRSGRRADALAAYQQLHTRLDTELGVGPSPQAAELHARILRTDPALEPGATPRADIAADRAHALPRQQPVPRQLPAAVRHFTGRAEEIKTLNTLLDEAASAVVISAIQGTAGIGKTALAVHWAHHVTGRFPDGQMYVNLHGYDASGIPVAPAEAIRGFLDALGVAPERVPPDLDAQAALYRSLLADRQMLVILDNACDAAQVRPLLPGSPACVVIITSRSQLTSLVAAEGARMLTLGLLSHAEARYLLSRQLGGERIDRESRAADELIELCARLPLALSIAAARAVTRAGLALDALIEDLRETQDRLAVLDTGDPCTNVRSVFSWSYRNLTGPAARLFRLLGVHPGPDISLPAAASLAGLRLAEAGRAIAELTGAHLLTEHVPGRYSFHDLLRAYAAGQAASCDSDTARHQAIHRMLDHYLHTAIDATMRTHPTRDCIVLPPVQPGVRPERLASHASAMAWFQAEHRVLLAALTQAANRGFDRYCWQLPWAMGHFLDRRGHWHEWAAAGRTALAAALRIEDLDGQARTRLDLGRVHLRLREYSQARSHLEDAAGLFRQLGDERGEATAHLVIAVADIGEERFDQALSRARESFRLFRAAGTLAGQGNAEGALGQAHTGLGEHVLALAHCHRALSLHRRAGDRIGEASDWDELGYAHRQLGRYPKAIACYRRAVAWHRALGDRAAEARSLGQLGDTHEEATEPAAAAAAWRQALRILEELQHPDAAGIRAKLHPSRQGPASGEDRGRMDPRRSSKRP
jgi:DNA-binding SARP family transcriptional activator